MQEAKLLLDVIDGAKLRSGRSVLEAARILCRGFGGCSFKIGAGCWFHESQFEFDPHVEFSVALDGTAWAQFEWVGHFLAAGQQTLYFVTPSGRVHIPTVVRGENIPFGAIAFIDGLLGREGQPSLLPRPAKPLDAWFENAPGAEFEV